MQIAFLGIILVLDAYFLGVKIRFKIDRASLIIVAAQLGALLIRVIIGIFGKVYLFEAIILIICYSIVQASLYYFIFEMRSVALKI